MCGICGAAFANRTTDAERQVRSMTAALRHRGPDEDGFLVNDARAPGRQCEVPANTSATVGDLFDPAQAAGRFGEFQLTQPGSFDPQRINRADFLQRGFE